MGKTTCARILAKTINCENLRPEGEACNECHSCVSFNNGTSMNIHELDAASNNSVDDIRALVDQVRFAPQAGKYKVYIIDEVHMLSSSAFNAFLKTLEEPPPYAIFILATTEKHKILPTILSRCQIFDFKRITLQDTVSHLQGIAGKEGITADETGLQLIAQKSEGCMRDALSILDKIVSFTSGHVTYENTIEHLNILDADYYFKLMDCMLDQDLAGAMLLYDDIDKKGFEGDMVLNGFAEFLRNVLICKDERISGLLEVVESFRQRYAQTAKRADAGYLVSALNILNEAEMGYRSARNKRLHVELALIKLCYLAQALQLTATDTGVVKKKITESGKALAFKALQPIAVKLAETPAAPLPEPAAAKLVIETPKREPMEQKPLPQPVSTPVAAQSAPPAQPAATTAKAAPAGKARLGSLDAIRQQVEQQSGATAGITDKALEMTALQEAWGKYIGHLKADKNPAWQSFEVAELEILDPHSFQATVGNNINQKFLEFERNKVSEFLQKELHNRQLQFSINLVESALEIEPQERPLSSKEQFLILAEQYPMLKELRERLRMELDF